MRGHHRTARVHDLWPMGFVCVQVRMNNQQTTARALGKGPGHYPNRPRLPIDPLAMPQPDNDGGDEVRAEVGVEVSAGVEVEARAGLRVVVGAGVANLARIDHPHGVEVHVTKWRGLVD